MNSADFAPFLLALLCAWLLGGVAARLGGLLVAGAGVAGFALDPGIEALAVLAGGAAIWLAGHWHYALRHQAFKGPLARQLLCGWAPRWLDPTRRWALGEPSRLSRRLRKEDVPSSGKESLRECQHRRSTPTS